MAAGKKSYLIGSTIIAALGGLLFGFDTAVISGTEKALQTIYSLSEFWLGFTVASALIGTIIGAVAASRPADRFGRKATLIWIAALYFVSAVGCAFAWDWYSLLIFRFIGGLGVGGASVVSPLYIAEISPARYRGRLVAVTQFNIVLGILLAFFSNYLIAQFDLGDLEWRWMFGVEAFPAAAFGILLFLTPRSPRWLVAQQKLDEAAKVLAKLGTDTDDIDTEIQEIVRSIESEKEAAAERFFQKAYLKPILMAIAIAAFNQLSGINALMYYGPRIFRMAGAGEDSALLQAVAVGVTNLIVTMAAMAIIDHFGRKKLMIVGSIGYILSLGCTAWAFFTYADSFHAAGEALKLIEQLRETAPNDPAALQAAQSQLQQAIESAGIGPTVVLVSLLVFIASHAFGQGAVIWVFLSEIFPNRVRARGQALGSFTHWFMCAAISWTFPIFAEKSGGLPFAFYACMMVLQLLWVLLIMPETKGIPLEQIQRRLGITPNGETT
ncbi:sugar porter family MFS transporter [Thermostilla marina]